MLVVPVHVEKNTKHSRGLYAASKIKKHELVWIFDPHVDVLIPRSIVQLWPADSQKQVNEWAYLSVDNVYMLCMDEIVFMKDSEFQSNIGTGPSVDCLIALCDIEVGTEIIGSKKHLQYEKLPVMAAMSKDNPLIH